MGQIVDGEDTADTPEALIRLAGGVEPGQGRSGVPVVGVDDVRPPVELERQVERGLAEEGEAVRVVPVAVDVGPGEEAVFGDEVDRYVAARQPTLERPGVDDARTGGHIEL